MVLQIEGWVHDTGTLIIETQRNTKKASLSNRSPFPDLAVLMWYSNHSKSRKARKAKQKAPHPLLTTPKTGLKTNDTVLQ